MQRARAGRDSAGSSSDGDDVASEGGGDGGDGGDGSASGDEEVEPRTCGNWTRADLFDRIMQESRHNSPGQCFSAKVREEVERLAPCARARLVARQRHGCAPLFVACLRGNVTLALYLLHACGASAEQRGVYRVANEAEAHGVTPLWCAAVSGRLEVLRALAEAGADIEAASDSGSTPLRSACFMSHVEVVRYLLRAGADPRAANHHGGTCLVNAVQSVELVRLLVAAGAPVDARDAQHKTALHYAVQEQREDTAHLLLAAGADPLLRSRAGDDALQLACIKGAARLVMGLVSALPELGTARIADAYELLGATQLDEYNDAIAALQSWRYATALRTRYTDRVVPKRPVVAPAMALRGALEWTTEAQLAAHAHDADWLRTQALLVALRVLGPAHNDTLFRLMYRGSSYADAGRFSRCVQLWMWVLELHIQRDTLLHAEANQTLFALTRLLVERVDGDGDGDGDAEEAPHVALQVLRHVAGALPECQRLLSIRPACRTQSNMFDRALRCVMHLLYVVHTGALSLVHTDYQQQQRQLIDKQLRAQVSALVRMELETCATGDSLLHLACSRLTVVRSTYFTEEMPQPAEVFPSGALALLLLARGADVTRRNRARCTPLHLAAIPYNFCTDLVETLLSWGAHLDQPNRFGDSPAELVQLNPSSRVRVLEHVTLACLAARALLRAVSRDAAPRLASRLPATLGTFLRLHLP